MAGKARTPEMDAWMDRNGGPLAGGPAAGRPAAGTSAAPGPQEPGGSASLQAGAGQGAAAPAATGAGPGPGGGLARDVRHVPPQTGRSPDPAGAAAPSSQGGPQPAPAVEQAKTLARLLGISPSWQPGQEAAAVNVLRRLKGLRNVRPPDRPEGFPGYIRQQGFAEGSAFHRECMDRFLGAHDGIGSAQGVDPKLPDPGASEGVLGRMVRALELSPKYAGGEVAGQLRALATKENAQVFLAVTIAFMTLQVTPAGWAADVLLVIAVGTTLAMSLVELRAILEDVVAAVRLVRSKDGDLDEAAKLIARVATRLTIDVFTAIVLHKANKAVTGPPRGGAGMGGMQPAMAGGARLPPAAAASDGLAAVGPGRQAVPPFMASMTGDPPGNNDGHSPDGDRAGGGSPPRKPPGEAPPGGDPLPGGGSQARPPTGSEQRRLNRDKNRPKPGTPAVPRPPFIPREVVDRLPKEWGDGFQTRSDGGWRWFDPKDEGTGVRFDPGNPAVTQPTQRVDHVVVRVKGRVIGRDGKPISGGLASDPVNGHIPLSDYRTWSTWDHP